MPNTVMSLNSMLESGSPPEQMWTRPKRRNLHYDAPDAAENKRTWQPIWVFELASSFIYEAGIQKNARPLAATITT